MNHQEYATTHDLIDPSSTFTVQKIHQCLRCNCPKPIKARGLCNSCYTHESREKSKKSSDSDKIRELEQELRKEREKYALLMGKGAYSTQDQVVSASYHLESSSSSTSSLNLSQLYVQEKTVEPLAYDAEKYRAHLEECKRKSKWSGWKEEKLISHFPCLTLFVEKYKEDVWAKRTKVERSLMESGQVESKSLTQTKGRIITISGQFFGLMETILPLSSSFAIQDLFSLKRIRVYLQFLEDLEREPCTIRNTILTLKHILKQFLSSNTFQLHHKEIQESAHFLDQERVFEKENAGIQQSETQFRRIT
jgi:hypothetical protein